MASDYVEELLWEGEQGHTATATMAAIGWALPHFSRHGSGELPQTKQAVQGFIKLSPARTRLPLPPSVMSLIAFHMVALGFRTAATMMLVGVSAYLRPGELVNLRGSQLVPPSKGGMTSSWGLSLHPQEMQKPSKTGQFNDTVLLDNPHHRFLQGPLARIKKATNDSDFLMGLTVTEFTAAFHRACQRANVQVLSPVPYHMRHTGASTDLVSKTRGVEEVKRRGRWQSDKSMNRYLKGGRLGEQFQRLSKATQQNCLNCHSRIGEILDGRSVQLRQ